MFERQVERVGFALFNTHLGPRCVSCLFQLSSLLPETLGTGKSLSHCCETWQAGPRCHQEGLWHLLMQRYRTLCFAASITCSPLRVGFTPVSCSHMAWRRSRSTGRRMDAQIHAAWQAQLEQVREDSPGCKDGEGGPRGSQLGTRFGLYLSKMDGFSTKPAFSACRSLRW